jgi:hypothetical protein
MIIGVSGKKRSGKDTVYRLIDGITGNEIRTVRAAFGDEIKQEIADAMSVTVESIDADKERFRPLLQWWGSEFRRGYCGGDYWLNKMKLATTSFYARDWLVITDIRFPNEADMVRELAGVLIRVDRDTGLSDTHSSEMALDDYEHFDYRINNNGPLDELETDVREIVSEIYKREPMSELSLER